MPPLSSTPSPSEPAPRLITQLASGSQEALKSTRVFVNNLMNKTGLPSRGRWLALKLGNEFTHNPRFFILKRFSAAETATLEKGLAPPNDRTFVFSDAGSIQCKDSSPPFRKIDGACRDSSNNHQESTWPWKNCQQIREECAAKSSCTAYIRNKKNDTCGLALTNPMDSDNTSRSNPETYECHDKTTSTTGRTTFRNPFDESEFDPEWESIWTIRGTYPGVYVYSANAVFSRNMQYLLYKQDGRFYLLYNILHTRRFREFFLDQTAGDPSNKRLKETPINLNAMVRDYCRLQVEDGDGKRAYLDPSCNMMQNNKTQHTYYASNIGNRVEFTSDEKEKYNGPNNAMLMNFTKATPSSQEPAASLCRGKINNYIATELDNNSFLARLKDRDFCSGDISMNICQNIVKAYGGDIRAAGAEFKTQCGEDSFTVNEAEEVRDSANNKKKKNTKGKKRDGAENKKGDGAENKNDGAGGEAGNENDEAGGEAGVENDEATKDDVPTVVLAFVKDHYVAVLVVVALLLVPLLANLASPRPERGAYRGGWSWVRAQRSISPHSGMRNE